MMQKRGHPVTDIAFRTVDISLDDPGVVEHCRAAQHITLHDRRGEADTEELR